MTPCRPDLTPPYYAVIFVNQRAAPDIDQGYGEMAQAMVELAAQQSGYLGIDSARDEAGFGITVSYWRSKEDIAKWKANSRHLVAQKLGKSRWYDSFSLYITQVERHEQFNAD